MADDWIKLHRKSLESRVFSDAQLWRLWCWCLLRSNWKRSWYAGCELQPGQFACGREAASAELGISGSAWYRGMKKLQEFGCIRIEANNRFSVISLVNWRKYQASGGTAEQQEDNERTTDEQQMNNKRTQSKKDNNFKKERNTLSLPESLRADEFAKIWDLWKSHRLEKYKPLGQIEEEAQLMDLARHGAEEAAAMVDYTIRKGAVGLITNGDHKQPPRKQRGSGAPKEKQGRFV